MTEVIEVANELCPVEEGRVLKAFFLTYGFIPTGEPIEAGQQTRF